METSPNNYFPETPKFQIFKENPDDSRTSTSRSNDKFRVRDSNTLAFRFAKTGCSKRTEKAQSETPSASEFKIEDTETDEFPQNEFDSRFNKIGESVRKSELFPRFVFRGSISASKIDTLNKDPIFSELLIDLKNDKFPTKCNKLAKVVSVIYINKNPNWIDIQLGILF